MLLRRVCILDLRAPLLQPSVVLEQCLKLNISLCQLSFKHLRLGRWSSVSGIWRILYSSSCMNCTAMMHCFQLLMPRLPMRCRLPLELGCGLSFCRNLQSIASGSSLGIDQVTQGGHTRHRQISFGGISGAEKKPHLSHNFRKKCSWPIFRSQSSLVELNRFLHRCPWHSFQAWCSTAGTGKCSVETPYQRESCLSRCDLGIDERATGDNRKPENLNSGQILLPRKFLIVL
mmetsp:Transcript_52540/g.119669  ORF Transcript_52540/g.119669 Transcript_52540/m.119669 type:complete len:231 (+) Transcript_52540:2490-3182(+)